MIGMCAFFSPNFVLTFNDPLIIIFKRKGSLSWCMSQSNQQVVTFGV